MLKQLYCWWFEHDFERYDVKGYVRLLRCKRCDQRFIMSDNHQAFLRYDNDESFKTDIKRMYPQLENVDI